MSKKQTIRLNETQLKNFVSKCVKNILNEKRMLNEDIGDLFTEAEECLKCGYSFRHAIHQFYNFSMDDAFEENDYPKKPMVPDGCEDESIKYISEAYYAANNAIVNLKKALEWLQQNYGEDNY